jgi:hypothetical protein
VKNFFYSCEQFFCDENWESITSPWQILLQKMESIISRVVISPSQFPELYNNGSGGREHLFALCRLQTIAKLDSSNVPYSSSRLRMPKQKKNLRFGSQSKHSHRSSSPFLCGGIRVVGLRESSGYLGQVFGAHSYNGSKWNASTWLDNT